MSAKIIRGSQAIRSPNKVYYDVHFFDCTFEDCRVTKFISCSFYRCDFRFTRLIVPHFSNCSFLRTFFPSNIHEIAVFIKCSPEGDFDSKKDTMGHDNYADIYRRYYLGTYLDYDDDDGAFYSKNTNVSAGQKLIDPIMLKPVEHYRSPQKQVPSYRSKDIELAKSWIKRPPQKLSTYHSYVFENSYGYGKNAVAQCSCVDELRALLKIGGK